MLVSVVQPQTLTNSSHIALDSMYEEHVEKAFEL